RAKADYGADVIGSPEHRALAREAAQKSIVLLKNEGALLPLKNVRNVTLFGRLADIPNTGDGGSSSTQPVSVVTLLEGLRSAMAGGQFIIKHDDGSDLARTETAAKFSDVAIVVVGYDAHDEGEFVAREPGPWNDHFPKPGPDEASLVARMNLARAAFPSTFAGDRASLRLH